MAERGEDLVADGGDGLDELIVRASKRKAMGWLALGLALIVPSWVPLLISPAADDPARRLAAAAGLLVTTSVWLLATLPRLVSSAPLLVVSHEGIHTRSRLGLIAWPQITGLTLRRSEVGPLHLTVLEVEVADPRPLLARRTRLQRLYWVGSGGRLKVWGALVLASGFLAAVPLADLLAEIQARFPGELRRHEIGIRALHG